MSQGQTKQNAARAARDLRKKEKQKHDKPPNTIEKELGEVDSPKLTRDHKDIEKLDS